MQFVNPVIPGFHPDPSICRVGNDYYLVNSSFHYFPGVPIFHSPDLVNWKQIGHCLNRPEQLELGQVGSSMGIFAPTLRHHKDHFYMITTNITGKASTTGNFYVRATDPAGEWSDPVWLDWLGIDPSLLFDEDDRVYITGTNSYGGEEPGIYQAEIDLETGKLLSPRRLIWKGTGGKSPEGPHLYNIENTYYLLIAEGGTEYGHMVTVARAQTPFGPFEGNPDNPILSHRSTDNPIQATGHADLVQAHDGSWWAVHLGIRPISRRHHLGRETFVAPVHWSEDGWPIIGLNAQVELNMEGPSFYAKHNVWEDRVDHFTAPTLEHTWNFLRNPYPVDWSLQERQGWLTLFGSKLTLNDTDSPACVMRRQQHMRCTASTLLEFQPAAQGDEAGLTVFMNERFHYEIALTHLNGKNRVILRKRIGSLTVLLKEIPYDEESIILHVEAEPKEYRFFIQSPGSDKILLGEGESSLLSTEVSGGFTGVYFGLYATGNGKQSESRADFDWFDYRAI